MPRITLKLGVTWREETLRWIRDPEGEEELSSLRIKTYGIGSNLLLVRQQLEMLEPFIRSHSSLKRLEICHSYRGSETSTRLIDYAKASSSMIAVAVSFEKLFLWQNVVDVVRHGRDVLTRVQMGSGDRGMRGPHPQELEDLAQAIASLTLLKGLAFENPHSHIYNHLPKFLAQIRSKHQHLERLEFLYPQSHSVAFLTPGLREFADCQIDLSIGCLVLYNEGDIGDLQFGLLNGASIQSLKICCRSIQYIKNFMNEVKQVPCLRKLELTQDRPLYLVKRDPLVLSHFNSQMSSLQELRLAQAMAPGERYDTFLAHNRWLKKLSIQARWGDSGGFNDCSIQQIALGLKDNQTITFLELDLHLKKLAFNLDPLVEVVSTGKTSLKALKISVYSVTDERSLCSLLVNPLCTLKYLDIAGFCAVQTGTSRSFFETSTAADLLRALPSNKKLESLKLSMEPDPNSLDEIPAALTVLPDLLPQINLLHLSVRAREPREPSEAVKSQWTALEENLLKGVEANKSLLSVSFLNMGKSNRGEFALAMKRSCQKNMQAMVSSAVGVSAEANPPSCPRALLPHALYRTLNYTGQRDEAWFERVKTLLGKAVPLPEDPNSFAKKMCQYSAADLSEDSKEEVKAFVGRAEKSPDWFANMMCRLSATDLSDHALEEVKLFIARAEETRKKGSVVRQG